MATVKSVVLSAAIGLSLTACAAGQKQLWYKDGATEASFKADVNRCDYEAEKATPDPTVTGSLATAVVSGGMTGARGTRLRDMCMEAAGYLRQP